MVLNGQIELENKLREWRLRNVTYLWNIIMHFICTSYIGSIKEPYHHNFLCRSIQYWVVPSKTICDLIIKEVGCRWNWPETRVVINVYPVNCLAHLVNSTCPLRRIVQKLYSQSTNCLNNTNRKCVFQPIWQVL